MFMKRIPSDIYQIKVWFYNLLFILLFYNPAFGFFDFVFEDNTSVILITIDTLQAKSLGVYGYSRDISPNIDEFAQDSFVFDNTFVMCNNTTPSHASILSSRHLSEHGILNNYQTKLDPNVVLLPEILRGRGYKTFASVSVFMLNPRISGLGKGFDSFSEHNDPDYKMLVDEKVGVRGSGVTDSFMGWYRKNEPKKFFAWLHYYDPHSAYVPPKEFNRFTNVNPHEFWKKIENEDCMNYSRKVLKTGRDLYDGEILYTDHEIGRVMNFLKKESLYDDALIVLTSDHGEDIEDHGPFFNHTNLFDEVLRGVLIIKLPKGFFFNTTGRTGALVASIDIAPTILDYLNIDIPDYFSGYSLLPLIEKKRKSVRDYIISEMANNMGFACILPGQRFFSYMEGRKKAAKREFYDVANDPKQLNDLSAFCPQGMKIAEKILQDWRQDSILGAEIDEPYGHQEQGDPGVGHSFSSDLATYHGSFFYLQMNFSNKKKAKFRLGKNLKDKDLVLNLAEFGRLNGKRYNLKEDFLTQKASKDNDFKRSEDYSIKKPSEYMTLKCSSRKIPIKKDLKTRHGEYYSYSLDVFIKDPGTKVRVDFLAWEGPNEPSVISMGTRRATKTVTVSGEWKHVFYVINYADLYDRISMEVEITGGSPVWLDNPEIRIFSDPFHCNPWNDPDLKEGVLNSKITLVAGNKEISNLPFSTRLCRMKELRSNFLDGDYSIGIFFDGDDLYFSFDSKYPNETLYVELGGYVGCSDDSLKKADESTILSKEEIENLKALGYID